MGVSGCGKSTVGAAIARELGGVYRDADDLHSVASVEKMRRGEPLSDADRWPWLDDVAAAMAAADTAVVMGCSALKRVYRDRLRRGGPVTFVHLHGERALIEARMQARDRHFMPASLLDSQFADLEPLTADETGLVVDIAQPLDVVIAQVLAALRP